MPAPDALPDRLSSFAANIRRLTLLEGAWALLLAVSGLFDLRFAGLGPALLRALYAALVGGLLIWATLGVAAVVEAQAEVLRSQRQIRDSLLGRRPPPP